MWLAVTEATLENGCLHVLPGSHREPVHEHVPDRRPGANYGYVEIVDHDMAGVGAGADGARRPAAVRQPPHAPLDRQRRRPASAAAMVFHYAATGTTEAVPNPVNEFVTVR